MNQIFQDIRRKRKIHSLISAMYECMTESDLYKSAAFFGEVYRLLPEHKKDDFVNELLQVTKNVC